MQAIWSSLWGIKFDPGGGFEPPLSDPESDVLPLNYPGTLTTRIASR